MKSTLALAILVATSTSALLVTAGAGPIQMKPVDCPQYPLKVGTSWKYIVTSGEQGPAKDEAKKAGTKPETVTIEVEREEPYVRETKNAENKDVKIKYTGFILKSVSGSKVQSDHVVVLEDGVYKILVARTEISPPLCFIKFGLKKLGDTWEVDSKSGDKTVKGTFTFEAEGVKVPAGNFKEAYRISFTNNVVGADRVEVQCWYVEKIGMVKQRVLQKEHWIVLELEEFKAAK
jgi:hypothetical protein